MEVQTATKVPRAAGAEPARPLPVLARRAPDVPPRVEHAVKGGEAAEVCAEAAVRSPAAMGVVTPARAGETLPPRAAFVALVGHVPASAGVAALPPAPLHAHAEVVPFLPAPLKGAQARPRVPALAVPAAPTSLSRLLGRHPSLLAEAPDEDVLLRSGPFAAVPEGVRQEVGELPPGRESAEEAATQPRAVPAVPQVALTIPHVRLVHSGSASGGATPLAVL